MNSFLKNEKKKSGKKDFLCCYKKHTLFFCKIGFIDKIQTKSPGTGIKSWDGFFNKPEKKIP